MRLATTRDKVQHDRQRRIWDRGFSVSGKFIRPIIEYAQLLGKKIEQENGGPVNVLR